MDIVRYLFARKCGIPKPYAMILAFIAGSKDKTTRLLLSNGGKLLLSGYGNDVYLALKPEDDSNA